MGQQISLKRLICLLPLIFFPLFLYLINMSKWQSKDLPIMFTMLALLVSTASDKIEELTSIPSEILMYVALVFLLIPLIIWISNWLRNIK